MQRILAATLFLLLPCVGTALAGTYYVDVDATGANDGTSWSDAWTSIQAAVAGVSTGTHHDVYVADGNYPETTYTYVSIARASLDVDFIASNGASPTLVNTHASYGVYISNASSVGFEGFTFSPTAATFTIRNNAVSCHLRLCDCTVNPPSSYGVYADANASSTSARGVELDGVTFGSYASSYAVMLADLGSASISDSTILSTSYGIGIAGSVAPGDDTYTITDTTVTATNACIYITHSSSLSNVTASGCGFAGLTGATASAVLGFAGRGITGTLLLDTCSFDGGDTAKIFVTGAPSVYYDRIALRNCTGTIGKGVEMAGRCGFVEMTGCTLTFTADDAKSLYLGMETDGAPVTSNGYPLHGGLIAGNTITCTSASATHLLFLGVGADGFAIVDNVIMAPNSSSAFGVVLKSDDHLVARNALYANETALYVAGCTGVVVDHNTIVTTTGAPFKIDTNQDGVIGNRNTATNNILVSADAQSILVDPTGANGLDDENIYADGNCYWTSGANVANIGGTSVSLSGGIASVQSAWQGYGAATDRCRMSDLHSLVIDPGLIDPENGNFNHFTVALIGAGIDGETIGAERGPSAAPHPPWIY